MRRLAVLGATGSVGTSCLKVIASQSDRMQVLGLTAHRSWQELAVQAQAVHPRVVVLADASCEPEVDRSRFPEGTELRFGPEAVEELAADAEVDTVVSAIVGAAGLRGTWAAVESGKRVAIANKETLVMAGPLVMGLAKKTGAELLPVDSEHSAIFQAMQSGSRAEVKRIILTASGGPFRTKPKEEFAEITPEMAANHPTWDMGPKITIDSATMMNKALEVIEAKWLFDLDATQIRVMVHPQSIIHSFVEFVDGSVIAQLSPPDMCLPIQYALTYPERTVGVSPAMDWSEVATLHLEPPDLERFPALELGFEVAARGGTTGCVLNAANEAAVDRFRDGSLHFTDIPRACRDVLQSHHYEAEPSLSQLFKLDAWVRQELAAWKG